jgi:hypothetical protein
MLKLISAKPLLPHGIDSRRKKRGCDIRLLGVFPEDEGTAKSVKTVKIVLNPLMLWKGLMNS